MSGLGVNLLILIVFAVTHGLSQGFEFSDMFKSILHGSCKLFGGCKAHQRCNPNNFRCLNNPQPINRTHFWTDCLHHNYVCPLFGFETDTRHKYGVEGEWCILGDSKVRCVAPDPPALHKPTPANHFKILTYNVFDRPLEIIHDGQRERTCRIPYWIMEHIPDVDVITLQEAFNGGCWHSANFYRLFAELGFPFHTQKLTKSPRLVNGGTIVFSRWPIVNEDGIIYNARRQLSGDYFAAKGVNYAQINKTVDGVSKQYHVMTTHLQAGRGDVNDRIREKQRDQWKSFKESLIIPEEEPLILTGDINIDYWTQKTHLLNVVEKLLVLISPLVGTHNYSFDTQQNDLASEASGKYIREWLDYILYSEIHKNPVSCRQTILEARTEDPLIYCWCNQYICPDVFGEYKHASKCKHVRKLAHLSDHNPVLGEFVF